MAERLPELTAEELALMTAFEERTGDVSPGVEPGAASARLSTEAREELDGLVALTARIDSIGLSPVAPSVRSAILNAAVAKVQQDEQPASPLAAFFAWLMRPGPVLIGTTAVALIAAFVARPQLKDAPDAASSMVALEQAPAKPDDDLSAAPRDANTGAQRAAGQGSAAALDSAGDLKRGAGAAPNGQPSAWEDSNSQQGGDKAAAPEASRRKTRSKAVAAPAQEAEMQAKGDDTVAGDKNAPAKKARSRRKPRTFAAQPASLGPAEPKAVDAPGYKLDADLNDSRGRQQGDDELAARASGSKRAPATSKTPRAQQNNADGATLELRKDGPAPSKYDARQADDDKSRFAQPPVATDTVAGSEQREQAPVWNRTTAGKSASGARSSSGARSVRKLAQNTYYGGRDRPAPSSGSSAPASAPQVASKSAAPARPARQRAAEAAAKGEKAKAQRAVSEAMARVGSSGGKAKAAEEAKEGARPSVAELITAYHRAKSDAQRHAAARAVLLAAKRNGDTATVKWASTELKKLQAAQVARARKMAKNKAAAKKKVAAKTKKAAPSRPSKPAASGAPARAKARAESYDSSSRK